MKSLKYVFCLLSFSIFGQNKDGYWDNVRTTNETIILGAGKRKFIKSADLPDGTTEVVYRISLLDDNQKLSSSLVSILKAIPDPTGISQGSAGAVYLLSTISGDDKCKYAIFNNENDAKEYELNGNVKNACFVQNIALNKDAKLLSKNSKCSISTRQNLWFAFESDNLIMKEKIVLEIVPWIDNNLKSGWNNDTKKQLLDICQSYENYSFIKDKEAFCGYFIEYVTQDCSYKTYSNFLQEEKIRFNSSQIDKALSKTGEDKMLAKLIGVKAQQLFNSGKKQDAIDLIQDKLINTKLASALDFNQLGKYYLLTRQYDKALSTFKIAEQLDKTDLLIKLNLSHAFLFKDEFKEVKRLHKAYKNQFISADTSWVQKTKSDFVEFEKLGLKIPKKDKILSIIK